MKPPGVYQEGSERRYTPLVLSRGGIPAFLGVARKGPLHVPVRIVSFEHFREVFGELDLDTYLAPAVEGFFLNGGREAYVLRVAHVTPTGGGQLAASASLAVRNAKGERTLLVEATSEGAWGDGIQLRVMPSEVTVQTVITLDLHPGDTTIAVKSTHGLARGTLLRLFDGKREMYRVIHEIDGKFISWSPAEPAEHGLASAAPTYVEPVEFEIEARGEGKREVFRNLSMARASQSYVERAVNGQSRLIKVTDLRPKGAYAELIPVDTGMTRLTGGADGIWSLTPEDFIGRTANSSERFGLQACESLEGIDLLCAPDLLWCLENAPGFPTDSHVEAVQLEMVSQSERTRDRFALLDFPRDRTPNEALTWRQGYDSDYCAFYYPWLKVDRAGTTLSVPPSGHVAGVYGRVDELFGTHHPPANVELHGVVDVESVLQEHDIGNLNAKGINCIKYFPTRGIRVWGARTTSNDSSLRYVNVRRIISAIIRSMNASLQWVVFEPNSPKLWKTLEREVSFFLHELWQRGFFQGRRAEDAFFVKCDYETNPPEVRDAGYMIVEVGVAPVRPAEYLVFRVEQQVEEVGPGAGTFAAGE